MRVTAYFATPPVVVNDGQDYSINSLQANLDHKVEQSNKRGSNFNIERVSRFVLSIHPFRPLHGSTFVRTPDFFGEKTLYNKRPKQGREMLHLERVVGAIPSNPRPTTFDKVQRL